MLEFNVYVVQFFSLFLSSFFLKRTNFFPSFMRNVYGCATEWRLFFFQRKTKRKKIITILGFWGWLYFSCSRTKGRLPADINGENVKQFFDYTFMYYVRFSLVSKKKEHNCIIFILFASTERQRAGAMRGRKTQFSFFFFVCHTF